MANWREGFAPGLLVVLAFGTSSPAQPVNPAGDPVKAWIERLRSPELKERLAAGYALEDVGLDPGAAARTLIAHLRDQDPFVRAHVAAALGEHRPAPDLSVPALVAALRDPDESVSDQAAVALGRIGGPAVPALVEVLKHTDASPARDAARAFDWPPPRRGLVAESAVFALGQVGAPALPPLIEAYREALALRPGKPRGTDVDPVRAALRAAILEVSPYAGRDGAALVVPLLDDPRPGARDLALEALAAMGPDASPAASRLVELLKASPVENPPEVWKESYEVELEVDILAQVGNPEVPPLLAMLRSNEATIRKRAALVLGRLSAPEPGVIAAMIERLDDPDESVRYWAASGLVNYGPKAVAALPGLLQALRKEVPGDRASQFLGKVVEALDRVANGPSPELTQSLPLLLELARSRGAWARGQAMQLMGVLGPAEAERTRPVLLVGLDDPEPDVRYRAALALWKLGKPEPEVARRLVELLDPPQRPAGGPRPPFEFPEPGKLDRSSYAREVADLGEAAREAVPAWVRLLQDEYVSYEAARALARVRPEGVSALIDLATDRERSADLRSRALEALAEVPRPNERIAAAVPAMLDLTKGADGKVNVKVVELIGRLGPDNPQVESTVARGLQDPDPNVRSGMAKVALQLGPEPARRLTPAVLRLLWDGNAIVRQETWDLLQYSSDSPVLGAAPIIAGLLLDPTADVRAQAAQVLARIGAAAAEARPRLWSAMEDRVPSVRAEAAGALVKINASLGELDPATLTMILDQEVVNLLNTRLRMIFQRSRPWLPPPDYYSYRIGLPPAGLPPFPWPAPPAPTDKGVSGRDFPREWLGKDDEPLSAVNDRLYQALQKADRNFDSSLFSVPDGFALLAKMERIREDGTPLPDPYRFKPGPIPPLNLLDYISRLFVEKPGHFRVIAFVVTSVPPTRPGAASLPDIREGAVKLTADLENLSFRGRDCYVLVYSFQKRPGGLTILRGEDGLNARTHLIKAGVLTP